jgi:SAM-dependent methyltransferase
MEWLELEYQLVEEDPWGLNWRGVEHCRYEQTLKVLEDAIVKLRKSRTEVKILDVGCSGGFFTHLLRDLGGSITGIDLSETAIQRARAKYNDITFQVGTVFDPALASGAYDIIICLEVIYYVNPAEQNAFLAVVKRLLTENGVLLISSKVGSPPYFSEEGLVRLATKHFKTAQISRYGCAPLAKCEGFLFGLWKKMHKVGRLLESVDLKKQSDLLEDMTASPQHRAVLQKLRFIAGKSRVLGRIIRGLARAVIVTTGVFLRGKFLWSVANWFARKLNRRPTHTLLLMTKN